MPTHQCRWLHEDEGLAPLEGRLRRPEIYGWRWERAGARGDAPDFIKRNPRLCRGLLQFDRSGMMPFEVGSVWGFDFASGEYHPRRSPCREGAWWALPRRRWRGFWAPIWRRALRAWR